MIHRTIKNSVTVAVTLFFCNPGKAYGSLRGIRCMESCSRQKYAFICLMSVFFFHFLRMACSSSSACMQESAV